MTVGWLISRATLTLVRDIFKLLTPFLTTTKDNLFYVCASKPSGAAAVNVYSGVNSVFGDKQLQFNVQQSLKEGLCGSESTEQ